MTLDGEGGDTTPKVDIGDATHKPSDGTPTGVTVSGQWHKAVLERDNGPIKETVAHRGTHPGTKQLVRSREAIQAQAVLLESEDLMTCGAVILAVEIGTDLTPGRIGVPIASQVDGPRGEPQFRSGVGSRKLKGDKIGQKELACCQ